jgi:hypothetical protein
VIFVTVLLAVLALLLVAPLLLVVVIALGPVMLGILCAVGFGLVVFAVVNLVIGLGMAGLAAGSRIARAHHS